MGVFTVEIKKQQIILFIIILQFSQYTLMNDLIVLFLEHLIFFYLQLNYSLNTTIILFSFFLFLIYQVFIVFQTILFFLTLLIFILNFKQEIFSLQNHQIINLFGFYQNYRFKINLRNILLTFLLFRVYFCIKPLNVLLLLNTLSLLHFLNIFLKLKIIKPQLCLIYPEIIHLMHQSKFSIFDFLK